MVEQPHLTPPTAEQRKAALSAAIQPGTRAERSFAVVREAVNVEARTVELAFASELPYERWWGEEVLDCTATSIRLQRLTQGGALLWNHDTDEQIGVVESVSIGADRVARAVVRFGKSARADEIFIDVADGVIRNVSVGYLIHEATLVEKSDTGPDRYRVTDWEPYEVSLVSVPADPSVGVGRSAHTPPHTPAQKAPAMTTAAPEVQATAAPAIQGVDAAATRQAERAQVAEMLKLGDLFAKFGGQDLAKKAIEKGESIEALRAQINNAFAAAQTTPVAELDMSPKDAKRFSVFKAIRAGLLEKNWKGAEFERECHEEILKRAGLPEAPHGGIYVPVDVMNRPMGGQRDLTVGTNSAGGYLVATDLQASSFIEMLRARSVVAGLGARMLPGLVGNVAIPKQSGAATAYWLTNEATAITESQQTVAQLALSPKTLGAYTELSRLLMLQSTPAAEQMVMADLAKQLALAIDLAALEGSGASGQPTGISNTAGIGSVAGTTIAYAGMVEFQTDVAGGNALTPGCAYVTTPTIAGLLMQRQRFSSTDTPLWQGNVLEGSNVCGYRGATTTQVTAASMTFGDFEQVVIGEWGLLELALNPYANFAAAITGIRAIQTVDVGIRQAAAFSRATSIT